MKKILAVLLAMLMVFSMAAVTVGAEGGTDANATAKKGIYDIPANATVYTLTDRHGNEQEYTVVRTLQELIDVVAEANEEVEIEPVMTENEDGTSTQTGVKIVNEMTLRIILANDLDGEGQVFDRAPIPLYRVASWAQDPLKPDELTYVSGDSMATYIFEGNGFAIKNFSVINTNATTAGDGTQNCVYKEDIEASLFGCATPNDYEFTNLDLGEETKWIKISSMAEGAWNGGFFQRMRTGASLYMKNVNAYVDIEVNNAQGFGAIAGTATADVWCYNVNVYGSLINRRKDEGGAGVGDQGGFFGGLAGNHRDGYAYEHYFEDCANWATIEATNNSGGFGGYCGGRWELVNCRNYGQLTTVTGTSNNINAGGFLAHTADLIKNADDAAAAPNSEGKTYKNSYDVNGVHFNQEVYTNCMNLAPITGGAGRTGGFKGCDRRETIYDNCYNYGIITGSMYTGGFAGYTGTYSGVSEKFATYRDCINYGRVVASGNNQGGFIGSLGNGAHWYNCMNVGEVIQAGTSAGDHISGFASYAPGGAPLLLENCTNIGTITANTLGGGKGGMLADCQNTLNMNGCYQFGYITSASPKNADGNFGHFVGTDRGGACFLKDGSSFGGNYAIDNAYSIANGISKINEYGVTPIADGETASETYVTPEEAVEMLNERYEEEGLLFRLNEETGMPMLAAPALRAVQHTDPEGDKQDIRLIGNLYSIDYKSAGFKVVVSYVDGEGETVTGDETTLTSSKVYKTICASDNGVLTNYSADKMLGVYLYALTIKDVPTNVGEVKITVTPVATIDNEGVEELYTGVAYVVTYNNGEYVETTPYVAPAA